MTGATFVHPGQDRFWPIDAAVGALCALVAITAAHAVLPRPPAAGSEPALPKLLPISARTAPQGPLPLISFASPLPGHEIGSPFGLRQLPWEDEGRLHAGVDIAAPKGEPIRAAADGVVVHMGVDGGYGRYVEVRHAEGLTSLYGHMGGFEPGVRPGAAVKAGEPIGRIGSTGTSTGSHLHFEIRDAEDRALNPELFLGHSFFRKAELPLRQAMRIPRSVRLAYVSMIPLAKQAEMDAKAAEAAAELAAAEADEAPAPPAQADAAAAADVSQAAVDASAPAEGPRMIDVQKVLKSYRQRPHGRYRM